MWTAEYLGFQGGTKNSYPSSDLTLAYRSVTLIMHINFSYVNHKEKHIQGKRGHVVQNVLVMLS